MVNRVRWPEGRPAWHRSCKPVRPPIESVTSPRIKALIKIVKTLIVLLLASAWSSFGVTISQWTFEVNTPADVNNSTAGPSVAADVGNGTASGFHASASTDWNTPTGNGSANSYGANTWGVGDYFQFRLSTVGFNGIAVTFDQASSPTGPGLFNFDYSTDGTVFTTFHANYTVLLTSGSWTSGSTTAGNTLSFNLGSISALQNAPDVFFRLVNQSTVAASGANRIDNFTVSGNSTRVPDSLPTPVGLFALVGLFAAFHFNALRRTA